MKEINKDTLYRLYVVEGKAMNEIADEIKVSVGSVYKYIHKYGIPARPPHKGFLGHKHSEEVKRKIGAIHKNKVVSQETRKKISVIKTVKGIGHKKKRWDRYIAIYFPDHPKSSKDGYIMEHDLVMEALIGRHLKDNECVHHINEKRDDNRKENLKLMTIKDHMSYHATKRWERIREKEGMTY